ncbi:MAG: pyroglutamyl-peptidase I, partial [Bacillota bacterium]
MKCVLVTGFQPFGGETVNPSLEAVKLLNGLVIDGYEVVIGEIPVVRFEATKTIVELIEQYQPEIVINVGQAGGRQEVSVERVGINVDDYRLADNAGNAPVDEAIAADGPAAYFATLPIKAMVKAMVAEGVPASVSNTAGTYLCNHVAYAVPHYIAAHRLPIRSCFIHIPFLPEQAAGKPGR